MGNEETEVIEDGAELCWKRGTGLKMMEIIVFLINLINK
jgi:hypothetical protein